jgi:hypothetical protein
MDGGALARMTFGKRIGEITREWLLNRVATVRAKIGLNLERIDLSKIGLEGAFLRHARLTGADLYHADWREADLAGMDLCCANLRSATVGRAQLRQADVLDDAVRLDGSCCRSEVHIYSVAA